MEQVKKNWFWYFMIIMIGLCPMISHAQEFVQKDIRVIYFYPWEDAPNKFAVKYISPTKNPPQDSIYEEKHHLYSAKRNDYLDRYSIFLWQYKEPTRLYVFHTSVMPLYLNPHFHYNWLDKEPTQKAIFYITDDVFHTGRVMVYTQGVTETYDNEARNGFKIPVDVIVSVFNMMDEKDPVNFDFNESVTKNTEFKVSTGKNGNTTYFKVDMYQESSYIKNIYDWNSVTGWPQKTVSILRKKMTVHQFKNLRYDVKGRLVGIP